MHPDLALFGKLHGHGDFVFAGNTGPVALECREWVEAGIGRAASHPEFTSGFDRGLAVAFVYRSKMVEERCLVGVMSPSRDAVGRRFPLVVGLEVEVEPYLAFPHLPPVAFGGTLQTIHERVIAGIRAGDVKVLAGALEHLGPALATPVLDEARAYTEWSQRVTVQEAFEWILDGFEEEWLERVLAFVRVASASGSGNGRFDTPVALRCPLGAAGAGGAALWLDVVRRVASWSQRVPTCFWSVSSLRSELVVQLGATPASTFAELWAPRKESEHICDLLDPARLEPEVETPAVLGSMPLFEMLCSL